MKLRTQILASLLTLLPTTSWSAPDRYGVPTVAVTDQPQTIEEKKSQLSPGSAPPTASPAALNQINHQLAQFHEQLSALHAQASVFYQKGAPEEQYRPLVTHIQTIRTQMAVAEDEWRRNNVAEPGEGYALWQQPETSLGQLVIDYGAQEYAYLIPPEIAGMHVSITSNIPIPREAWGDMLSLILTQNGVGVRQLNPFLRQLYLLSDGAKGLRVILDKREQLETMPSQARVGFVLVPSAPDVGGISQLLEKFINPQLTTLYSVGRSLLVVGPAQEISELLKVYDFVATSYGQREYRIIPLSKSNPQDMEVILNAIFAQSAAKEGAEASSLKIMALPNAAGSLFMLGSAQDVREAERIAAEIEGQLDDPKERVIYWYTCRHSDPREVAQALAEVYSLLTKKGGARMEGEEGEVVPGETIGPPSPPQPSNEAIQRAIFGPPYLQPYEAGFGAGQLVVSPTKLTGPQRAIGFDSFVVDGKTSSIIMVVEQESLPQIKKLLRRLDSPPKMVQLDVLLFEKRVTERTNFGLNLLRIGADALNKNQTGGNFNNIFPKTLGDGVVPPIPVNLANAGIFQFFLGRKATGGAPAYDISYQFLMTQNDVVINSSPSVTTMNQTPAVINIVDQISINTGTVIVGTGASSTAQQSFVRAEYGTIIEVTPTINAPGLEELDEDELLEYHGEVTLDTTVTFDTISPTAMSNQPDITRRNIKNHVRVADGETVILGGLRRKTTSDFVEKIPFLGEIPGVGKLFSNTHLMDDSTEMFIFITPHIVSDPGCEVDRIRRLEMIWRPGDVPEYLGALDASLRYEQNRFMRQGLEMILGRPAPGIIPCEFE